MVEPLFPSDSPCPQCGGEVRLAYYYDETETDSVYECANPNCDYTIGFG